MWPEKEARAAASRAPQRHQRTFCDQGARQAQSADDRLGIPQQREEEQVAQTQNPVTARVYG